MCKLLVVDDNQQNLYLLKVLLSADGFEVESAQHGAEALEKAHETPPDIIISDILMPVMDGYSLCREWKKDETLKYIPFVFYTATYTNPKDEEFALSLGADRFIIKPVEPDIFLKMLHETLDASMVSQPATAHTIDEDTEYYKKYNITLIRKLEDKMQQLEETNRKLEQDIIERKQAEEDRHRLETQLHQAQKMESVGRLAGGVAHDFNNVLQVILGNAEMAMRQVDQSHPLFTNLADIHKAALHSADLTRQLLAFARKQTIEPQVLVLNSTVSGMFKMLQRIIGEDIRLNWQPTEDVWQIRMDPTQLDQILANLCVNARDAISGVGEINISTSHCSINEKYCAAHPGFIPGEFIRLSVSDNGCGMDDDTKAHVFEPFFTTKEAGKGTGLGLATVYGIVSQNNGFIDIISQPDKGTEFHVYLPCYAGCGGKEKVKKTRQPVDLGQTTILLVEDDLANLTVTTKMLEQEGCTVLAANSPSEAMKLLYSDERMIHLVLSDIIMPEMSGLDLVKNLRPFNPELKFMFMSGYTDDIICNQCKDDNSVSVIQKPFSIHALITKIGEVLEN